MINKATNFIKKHFDKKSPEHRRIADFYSSMVRVDNDYISKSSILVDERLPGNIYSLEEVVVAEKAEISGNITSRICTISGKVKGDILSTVCARIKSTAVITGNITAQSIDIEPGSVINGSIRVENKIDECDLIAKVEYRPAATGAKVWSSIPYTAKDRHDQQEAVPVKKPAPQAPRSSGQNQWLSSPEVKEDQVPELPKPKSSVFDGSGNNAPNRWY